jgi:hypothetical protein
MCEIIFQNCFIMLPSISFDLLNVPAKVRNLNFICNLLSVICDGDRPSLPPISKESQFCITHWTKKL